MPPTWLGRFSSGARLAYSGIVSGVRQGLSTAAIGAKLRSGGLSIANDALREIAARERANWQHSLSLKFTPLDRPINVARLPEALTVLRSQFSFTVEVRGRKMNSQESIRQYVTVTTNKELTRRQIENAARRAVVGGPSAEGIAVEKVVLFSGLRAGEAGTL